MGRKKDFRTELAYQVGTWVSFDTKSKLYEIAHRENVTISELARRMLEKAISEYEEVNKNGD